MLKRIQIKPLPMTMLIANLLLVGFQVAYADVFDRPSMIKDLGTTTIAPGGNAPVVEITPRRSTRGSLPFPWTTFRS